MESPVSIIIVNYNGKQFLSACLSSVLKQEYPNFEIILIDNGSYDGSAEFVHKQFPSVKVFSLEKNIGFAGGNNFGVQQAQYNLIVLLNNDTTVEQNWLRNLAAAVQPDDVAVASSLILTEGIPQKYYEMNGSINFLGHNIMRIYHKKEDIFFAGGASLMFKRDIVGIPFDDEYFAYGEDVYVSVKARFAGFRVIHVNNSIVHHYGSGTSRNQKSSVRTFYQERNRLLNTFLFFSPKTLVKLLPLFAFNTAAKILAGFLPTKYSLSGIAQAYWWLLCHIGLIRKKRRELAGIKKVAEEEIISRMTCKLTNGETTVGRFVNAIATVYFKIVNIRTIELINAESF